MPVSIGGSTGIGGNDGTVGTPAVRGSANNTGIYFPSAGNVAIAINGVQKVLIDNTGIITSNGVNLLSTFIANTATEAGQIPFSTNGSTFTPSQKIVLGTAVASTSGTSIDFTGIPSWVKRIIVMFNGVSTSGSSDPLVQIGAGSVTITGYVSSSSYVVQAASSAWGSSTAGFNIRDANSAGVRYGNMVIINVSGNIWVATHQLSDVPNGTTVQGAGGITLSGALDRVRITTTNGTDTFDAGSINIMYE